MLLFPWRWWLLPPKTPGSALQPLNNDFVILFILSKSAWCADSSSPGGGLFGLGNHARVQESPWTGVSNYTAGQPLCPLLHPQQSLLIDRGTTEPGCCRNLDVRAGYSGLVGELKIGHIFFFLLPSGSTMAM